MKRSLLPYLACLFCSGDIKLESVDETTPGELEEEVLEGMLACQQCTRAYAIRRGVPRFVDKVLSKPEDVVTGARFYDSWKQFSRMDPRYWGQFFDWVNPVYPEFVKGKVVLEAGCGKGRHAEIMRRAGVKDVVSVDIADTVDIAYQTVGGLSSIHIVQADIANLPLKQVFDFGFSVGVLHHMTDPYYGFASLLSKIKTTGAISCWVYGRENNGWLVNIVSPIRVAITARMPAPLLTVLSVMLALPLYLYCRFLAGPWRQTQKALPFLPDVFYQEYLSYIGKFDFTEVLHIVFDHLVTPVAHYLSREEVTDWCDRAGLTHPIVRWHNENSWTLFSTVDNSDPNDMLGLREAVPDAYATTP